MIDKENDDDNEKPKDNNFIKLTTVANRVFPVVDSRTWNDLPYNNDICQVPSRGPSSASVSRLISSQKHFLSPGLTVSLSHGLCL